MRLEKLAGDGKHALDKVVPTTWNAEKSGNLRCGDAETGAALKPSMTVSLMKLIRVLSRKSHATMRMAATTNAERVAI
jgi:hypothetical protein